MVTRLDLRHVLAQPIDDPVRELGQRLRRRAGRVRQRAALLERGANMAVRTSERLEQRGEWLEREGGAGVLRGAGNSLRRWWWLGLVALVLVALVIGLRQWRARSSEPDEQLELPEMPSIAPPEVDAPAGA